MRDQVCRKCRKKFPKDADFCVACGAPRGRVNPVVLGAALAVCVAVIAVWVVGFVYWRTSRLFFLVPAIAILLLIPPGLVSERREKTIQWYVNLVTVILAFFWVITTITDPNLHWP